MSQSIRPQKGDFADYFDIYVSKVPDGPIYETLKNTSPASYDFLAAIPEEKWTYRYAPGKWSIKEMIIHLGDAERVFANRMLRIARNDQTPLPGFDHNTYIEHYQTEKRSVDSIIEEYKSIRAATLSLLAHLDDEALGRKGTASGFPVTALALGFIIAGHEAHHFKILKERYLNE